jgi:hypothetical protein
MRAKKTSDPFVWACCEDCPHTEAQDCPVYRGTATVRARIDEATKHETHATLSGGEIDVDAAATDSGALDDLVDILSGRAWTPETLERVAEIVRASGRDVDEVQA